MLLTSVLPVFVALALLSVAVVLGSLRRRPDERGPRRRAVWLSGLAALLTMLLTLIVALGLAWVAMLVLLVNLGYDIWYESTGALPVWVDALWWVLQAIALVCALFVGWKVWKS